MRISEALFNEVKKSLEVKGILLDKLNLGDVLKVTVVESGSKNVILSMHDGTRISAKAPNLSDFMVGEVLNLLVKEKTDGKVFMSLIQENNQVNHEVQKSEIALNKLNFNITKENIDNVQVLKKQGIEVTKETLQNFMNSVKMISKNLSQTNTNKNKQIENLKENVAFMFKNNIEPNNFSMKHLSNFITDKNYLANNIENLKNSILRGLNKNEKSNIVLQVFTRREMESKKDLLIDNMKESIKLNISNKNTMDTNENMIKLSKEVESKLLNFLSTNMATNNLSDKNLFNQFTTLISQNDQHIPVLKNIFELLSSKFEELFKDISQGIKESTDKYTNIKIDTEIKNIFKSLNKDTIFEKEAIIKNYREILDIIEIVKTKTSPEHGQVRNDILNTSDNIESHLKFINNLNQNYNYLQIPININEHNKTVELFIMKNKNKKSKINPNDATMFLALDTVKIGNIETFIKFKNKNIGINIRVENEHIQEHVRNNYKKLYDLISDIGYNLVDMKCKVKSNMTDIINMENELNEEFNNESSRIDFKI